MNRVDEIDQKHERLHRSWFFRIQSKYPNPDFCDVCYLLAALERGIYKEPPHTDQWAQTTGVKSD